MLLFAVKLQWLPASWTGGQGATPHGTAVVVALRLPQIAYIARLTRASLIDVLSSDFVRTARAQGLGTATIVRYHALKAGDAARAVLYGARHRRGADRLRRGRGDLRHSRLGQMFVRASLNRDYTLVLGCVIVYASLIVLMNLVVDLLYGAIDPRIRSDERS